MTTMLPRLCFVLLFCVTVSSASGTGREFEAGEGHKETGNVETFQDTPSQIKCNEYRKKQDVCTGFNDTADVTPGELPHMVMVSSTYLPFGESKMNRVCGGVLISEDFVLTSGVCALIVQTIMTEGEAFVQLGDVQKNFLNDEAETNNMTQTIQVVKTFLHPKFNKEEKNHNCVGLLQLATSAKLNDFVRPACLQTRKNLTAGSTLFVSDWNRGEDGSHTLRAHLAEPLSYKEIKIKPLSDKQNSMTSLCVKTTADVRSWDDGATILQALSPPPNCIYTVIGISGLAQCGSAKEPSSLSYARVYPNVQWIEQTVWPKVRAVKKPN